MYVNPVLDAGQVRAPTYLEVDAVIAGRSMHGQKAQWDHRRHQQRCVVDRHPQQLRVPQHMPPHELKLKVGCVVMLLRNLHTTRGLCNGLRAVQRRLPDAGGSSTW